jgi:hypothetical protein
MHQINNIYQKLLNIEKFKEAEKLLKKLTSRGLGPKKAI